MKITLYVNMADLLNFLKGKETFLWAYVLNTTSTPVQMEIDLDKFDIVTHSSSELAWRVSRKV